MDSGTRWERTVGGRCNTRLECRGGFSSRKKLPGTLPNSPDLLGIGGPPTRPRLEMTIFERVPDQPWREVSLRMARHASFLSFFHSIPSILHHSLRPLRPLTPTPRSTCTWGSRSRSSACSPRASPQDSLSGPPRRSPSWKNRVQLWLSEQRRAGGAGVCRSSFG